MSGISGIAFVESNRRIEEHAILKMVRDLSFDAQSQTVVGNYGSVAFGAEVSEGVLSGVTQSTRHKHSLALAFYGNVLNGPKLFSEFDTREVAPLYQLLAWYEKEGIEFLSKLRGEFVLALWDGETETLYLACDRLRVYPLFYYQDQKKLVFASRMKGIVNCPYQTELSVNHTSVIDMVTNSFIPTPKTIFREIQKLPPGFLLRYRHGEIRLESYWDISFLDQSHKSENSQAAVLRSMFAESVSLRMGADAPIKEIGSFLSGGVDSTAVTGVLTQLSKEQVNCFTIGFSEEKYNEIEYARIAARAFEANHYEYFVSPNDVSEMISILIESFDEPFGNASSIPTYFCAKLAKECGVKELYAGDGGDELFAGNERYRKQLIFQDYHRIPLWLRSMVFEPLIFTLAGQGVGGIFCKARSYIRRAAVPYPDRLFAYNIFEEVPRDSLFEQNFLDLVGKDYDPFDVYRAHYVHAPAKTELEKQLYMDLKLTIADNDLFKVTRMTECAGVKVQFPFLDYRLVEFAATVPARTKMRRKNLRSFFKRAYADILPSSIQTKQKHGFGLPIPIWLRTDRRLNEMMHDLVLSPTSTQRGYFQKKTLERLIHEHQSDRTGFYGTILWNLMMLELWNRMPISKIPS